MSNDLDRFTISPDDSIHDAIKCMDSNGLFIAIVVDGEGRLLDTVTDGDVRRAILAGVALDSQVSVLQTRRASSPYPEPITAIDGTTPSAMAELMEERTVRHLPVVDQNNKLLRVVTLAELRQSEDVPLNAVIMAGGFGTRLRPLTDNRPKPMLPVGEKPLLEHMVSQLQQAGIQSLSVTTHYKKEMITDHFKDGAEFGIAINYVEEDQPLGTAGALSLLQHTEGPLLVINGDILTRVNFAAMLSFHNEHHAMMTVGIRPLETTVPFGVVESDGVDIKGIVEKPTLTHFISAGVYLLDPSAVGLIPHGERYDMPDLVNELTKRGNRVVGFPIREYWLDIGRIEDYERAQEDAAAPGGQA